MESTGTFVQNLYAVFIFGSFEVIPYHEKFIKNMKGKKTDIFDSMWIQKLHTLGVVTGTSWGMLTIFLFGLLAV